MHVHKAIKNYSLYKITYIYGTIIACLYNERLSLYNINQFFKKYIYIYIYIYIYTFFLRFLFAKGMIFVKQLEDEQFDVK